MKNNKLFLTLFSCGTFLLGCSIINGRQEAIQTVSIQQTPSSDILPTEPNPNERYPAFINPLTGLEVEDPSLLDLPTVLVSISHFPATARPQAGLSFSPMVFEIYITEGATRFLTTFYGEIPSPEKPTLGHCKVRGEPFEQIDFLIGNRIWFDENENNIQDDWEQGIGGVCINLYDNDLNLIRSTSTDSNGYYAFNVTNGNYLIAVDKPDRMEFSKMGIGNDDRDSDINPSSGYIEDINITESRFDLDVGMVPAQGYQPLESFTPARVGPVRSGRLIYADIANFYKGSCLIFAYASPEVLSELPKCSYVDHIIQGGGYMLDISRMSELANERKDNRTRSNYISNIFSNETPHGGSPAIELDVFYAWLHQSAWKYDPASQSYWRYVDTSEENTAGILHPEIERLNGRQLKFENLIVLFAKHDVISPTNLDIHLEAGLTGRAIIFRDGKSYPILWKVEKDKPILFLDENGKLFPLQPGHTWVTVVTTASTVEETEPGIWLLHFSQPKGAK